MSATHPKHDAEQRQRLHDGELGDDAGAARARAEASPEGRAELAALAQLGDLLRADAARAADEAEPAMDAIWARLEREMSPAAQAPTSPSYGERLRGWFTLPQLATGLVGAAAGAVLVVALREPRIVERHVHHMPPQTTVGGGPGAPGDVVPALHVAAEVESLEVVGGTGTVFQVEGDDGDESTVIWVTRDEPSGSEGPI